MYSDDIYKRFVKFSKYFRYCKRFLFVWSSIIEYDAEGFNEVSILLNHGGFFFILYGELLMPSITSTDGLTVFFCYVSTAYFTTLTGDDSF